MNGEATADPTPLSPEPLTAEEEAALRGAMRVAWPNEDNRTEYIRRLLATLDAARSPADPSPEPLREALREELDAADAIAASDHDAYDCPGDTAYRLVRPFLDAALAPVGSGSISTERAFGQGFGCTS